MICILAHGGASSRDDPEGGAGSGVLRPRLVTAGSGGPGHRPPGMMTWLRGARCTDPEAMPEMEARPPAENRHGGAPRGERPASWDAPRLTRADAVASRKRDNRNSAPVGAPPTPLRVGDATRSRGPNPGATTRRGNEEDCTLFDIVNAATGNGSLRAPRIRVPELPHPEGRRSRCLEGWAGHRWLSWPRASRRRTGPEAARSWSPQQDLESGRYERDIVFGQGQRAWQIDAVGRHRIGRRIASARCRRGRR